ncbi:MAG: hypothetical protein O7E54_10250 [Planctomycetota bacterium]|nr:hypothetical protein [Planctomycetota bacterium]
MRTLLALTLLSTLVWPLPDKVVDTANLKGGDIVVKDKNGKVRCRISLNEKGGLTIVTTDPKGNPVELLVVDRKGKLEGVIIPPARALKAAALKKSKWDPPANLGHLDETTNEERARIDKLIKTMLDPDMGRDSHKARQELVRFGKKAFPRILGEMAKIRDTITDKDDDEERLIESGLMLGDNCLREIDPYLNAFNKTVLRPGASKRYIVYILRLHYKRWMTDLNPPPKKPK